MRGRGISRRATHRVSRFFPQLRGLCSMCCLMLHTASAGWGQHQRRARGAAAGKVAGMRAYTGGTPQGPGSHAVCMTSSLRIKEVSSQITILLLMVPLSITLSVCFSQSKNHLMTLSALKSIDWGIVRPICLAVFRLMTSSNFVACSTGSSAGLTPFRILSTYVAALRNNAW